MKKLFFTADAHLGAAIHTDRRAAEQRLTAWVESVADSAEAIYFLGDMFDYWHEWKYVVPKGFTRFLGAVARVADSGVAVHFFTGNHDVWMKGYFEEELGAMVHHKALLLTDRGKTFRLAHGDEEYRAHSRKEALLYDIFRNPVLQKLYAGLHPRWSTVIANRSSASSRKRHIAQDYAVTAAPPEEEWLVKWAARDALRHPDTDFWLFGHRHRLIDYPLGNGKRVLLLGDWIRYNSFAEWDGSELSLRTFAPSGGQ